MGPLLGFGAAIIFGVGAGASAAYALAVSIARFALLSLVSKFLAPKIDLQQTAEDKLFTVKSAIQPQAFVYGQDMLSGPLIFTNVSGGSNEFLHRLVALTGREIDDIVAFRIDDTDLVVGTHIAARNGTVSSGNFADVVTIATELGTSTQAAIAQLVTDFPTLWTSAHQARGWSLLYVRMEIVGGNTAFEKGVPQNLRALVNGHKIYDPRLDSTQTELGGSGAHRLATPSTWEWSENPALCLADWLMWDSVGLGESGARIDWQLVADAADICDETVLIPPAVPTTTQKRYTCNFTFFSDQERGQIKNILEGAMLGRCVFSQGKWRMYAGAPLTATVTLDEANLAPGGGVQVEASTAAKQRYNTVRGKFVDPTRDYHANAYPEQTNSSYVSDDNGEVKYKTVDFNACNNSYECQRNAIITTRQSRNQKIVRFPGNWSCFQLQVGHVVDLSIVELGWNQDAGPPTDKKFMVTEWSVAKDFRGVSLVMVEENDSVWADPAVGDYTTRDPTGELVPPDELAVKLSDATIANRSETKPVYAGIRLDAGGRLRYGNAGNVYYDNLVPLGEWLGSGTDDYSVKATVTDGALESGTEDTWEALSADRTWYCKSDGADAAVVQIDITNDPLAGTPPILATADFDLSTEEPGSLRDAAVTIQLGGDGTKALTKPTIVAGDLLFVTRAGTDDPKAGWSRILSTNTVYYYRTATGTSADDLTLKAPPDTAYGTVAIYAAFRPGATSLLQNGPLRSVVQSNPTGIFVQGDLSANAGKTNTLAIFASARFAENATTTPIFSNAGNVTFAAEVYQDFNAVAPFTSARAWYCALGYSLEPTADVIAQDNTGFTYSPFEGGSGNVQSDGRSFRFEA